MNAFVRTQLAAAAAPEAGAPDWLVQARRNARAGFEASGLPGPRDESWKYTTLRALEARTPALGDAQAASRTVDLAGQPLGAVDGPRLVFVNGSFRADLSRLHDLPAGVELRPVSSMLADHSEDLRAVFDDHTGVGGALQSLNTALARDGVWLRVAAGTQVAQPIHLLVVGAPAATDIAWHLRHAIELGAGASAQVVEQYLDDSATVQFGNVVEHVRLEPGSRLDHVRLQDCAVSTTLVSRAEVHVAAGAALRSVALELGAGTARRELHVRLEGAGAQLDAWGAAALGGRQHGDVHYEVRHVARDTRCDLRWRGIADQRARAVFTGAIMVERGADGADAKLSNRNLLLSPHAEIDSRPVLEIHADEVKAAHGATVGRLDEQALFYLRSRGVPEHAARGMLTHAFCAEVLAAVAPDSLRAALATCLARHLPQALEPAA